VEFVDGTGAAAVGEALQLELEIVSSLPTPEQQPSFARVRVVWTDDFCIVEVFRGNGELTRRKSLSRTAAPLLVSESAALIAQAGVQELSIEEAKRQPLPTPPPVLAADVKLKTEEPPPSGIRLGVAAFAQLGALTPAQWLAANTGRRSLLAAPLPQNVHLATVQAKSASRALLRLAHLFGAGESATLSQNATVSLAGLFDGKTVASAVEMTLPGSQPLAGVPQRTYVTDGGAKVTVPILPPPPSGAGMDVVLGPMGIRTFEITFA
jgi:hypothetical protein